ncbi:LysR family transcriptional regulator [Paeniclostridium sordellii]|nr:LysR family transcriptional regulator [Paeniclostridium sordellii]
MQDFRMNTFLSVCRTLNYTRSAAELNITQPAVSQHIAYLEKAYGAKLLSYHGKKLTLTPAGELLRDAAATMAHDEATLRDAIGRAGAAEVAIRREQLDRELKRVLEEKVAAWGVTILSVEVRDILLPKELQDVMSLEAQAEQRKKARIILMEAEQDICEMMDDMGDTYAKNDAALRLRAMHLLYESVRETGGTVVVPSSFSEGFGDVLGDAAKDALGGKAEA